LNYENQKFSKSRGIGVFGDAAISTGIPSDIWRFYLLYIRPEGQDSTFSWDDFAAKVNSELNANLGNFVNRALKFLFNFFNGTVPEIQIDKENDAEFFTEVNKSLAEYTEALEHVKIRSALQHILAVSRQGNLYMQVNEPWKLVKSANQADKDRAASVIGIVANLAALLSVMLYPFMPDASAEIRRQCGIDALLSLPKHFIQFLPTGSKTNEPKALFSLLDRSKIAEWKLKFGSSSENTPEPMSAPVDNQEMISRLLAQAESKFDVLRKIFVQTETTKLNAVKDGLQKEIEALRIEMENCEKASGVAVYSSDAIKVIRELKDKSVSIEKEAAVVQDQPKETKPKIEQPKEDQPKNKQKEPKKKEPKKPAEKEEDLVVDVGRLDLRVGRIMEVSKHPDADSLYVEKIDLGEGHLRTVISGLVKHVPIDEMKDRLVVCVCNLKPAKMRGIESQAMILCASTPEKVEIMSVDPESKPGDRVFSNAFPHRPDAILNPKKKVWEMVAVDLKVSDDGKAVYKGEELLVEGKTPLTALTLRQVPIK